MATNQKLKLAQGIRIPRQISGGPCLMLDKNFANLVFAAVESWLNCVIAQGVLDANGVEIDVALADIKHNELGSLITLQPAVASSGGTVVVGGSNDRGLWSAAPANPYMTFDKVILQIGTATGYYISTIDNNPNSPDSGIGWIQLATTQGVWL